MMEEILKHAVSQVPAIAVLAVVVWMVLRFLKSMGANCHEVQQEGHQLFRDISKALGDNTAAHKESTIASRESKAVSSEVKKLLENLNGKLKV